MGRILTNQEVAELEKRIEEINARAEVLDPSNSFESRVLERDHAALLGYIQTLQNSHKHARIKESGLRLVG